MKNKIILGIILIAILFGLCGCTTKGEAKAEEVQDRLVTIYKQGDFSILVDTRTNVEYMLYSKMYLKSGAGGLTVLLNQDGTPLLYGGE